MSAARAALAASLGLLLAACAARARPNVLLVVLDTARADRFSFDGYARDTSPRLDSLAAEGILYLKAYTPAPWTLPAHASLFTGLYPSAHGADSGHLRLDDDQVTLAELTACLDCRYRLTFHDSSDPSADLCVERYATFGELQAEIARRRLSEYSIAGATLEDVYLELVGERFPDEAAQGERR